MTTEKKASLNECARKRTDFIWTEWKTHQCVRSDEKSILPTYGHNVCTTTTERACLNTIPQACRHVLNGNPLFLFILCRNPCQDYLRTDCVKRKTESIPIKKTHLPDNKETGGQSSCGLFYLVLNIRTKGCGIKNINTMTEWAENCYIVARNNCSKEQKFKMH